MTHTHVEQDTGHTRPHGGAPCPTLSSFTRYVARVTHRQVLSRTQGFKQRLCLSVEGAAECRTAPAGRTPTQAVSCASRHMPVCLQMQFVLGPPSRPFLGGRRACREGRHNPSKALHAQQHVHTQAGPWGPVSTGCCSTGAVRRLLDDKKGSPKHAHTVGSRSACRHAGYHHASQWIREVPCCEYRADVHGPTPHTMHIARVHRSCTVALHVVAHRPLTTNAWC